ncbi:hypothetical protein Tco_0214177 [Tanacetum coccineum]
MAKRAQPVLYDADTLLHPNHHPVSIWDSEEVLVSPVVSMKKMNEKPGHAYWLSANEIASQASKSATPATPFVREKSIRPSQSSCDQQALETDRIQLKDTITSLRIQLDGLCLKL